jgi:hypothetical protein
MSELVAATAVGHGACRAEHLFGDVRDPRVWDEDLLEAAGVPIADTTIVTVGGGLGSFAAVDFWRIAGLDTSQIRVLSNLATPYQTFQSRALASQLGPQERLRSDSSSTIHNIWGWPGYALVEAWRERTLRPLWQVITEPFLSEYFTPRVRTVTRGVQREAERIGWAEMLVPSWAELVRRRAAGGYFVLARGAQDRAPIAYRCQHVHLALGHPGVRVLPDVQAFRQAHPDSCQLANAYEPHEHIYESLLRKPARVVVRGSGIGASRILERLIQDREQRGAKTEIVHLFRNYVAAAVGPPWFRRPGGDGFAYQPFNFPRGAGGGQLRRRMLAMSGPERARLISQIGGTTTAWRRRWQAQLQRGRSEGWYRTQEGQVRELARGGDGELRLLFEPRRGEPQHLAAEFLIDATGLEDSVERHPVIADLIATHGVAQNALGRLDVAPSFEVPGMRSGAGRVYASGAATLGGALAPVDSFWGLMHAAMEITDDIADQGTLEFPGVMRSLTQWWRWVRNLPP